MNIHELLEQKFRSGNGVEVSSVRISRAEWEAAQPVAALGLTAQHILSAVEARSKISKTGMIDGELLASDIRWILAGATQKPEQQELSGGRYVKLMGAVRFGKGVCTFGESRMRDPDNW